MFISIPQIIVWQEDQIGDPNENFKEIVDLFILKEDSPILTWTTATFMSTPAPDFYILKKGDGSFEEEEGKKAFENICVSFIVLASLEVN